MTNLKEEVDISKMYAENSKLKKEQFIQKQGISDFGVSSEEAVKRIKAYGFNEIRQTKPKRWYNYFLESLFTPFNCILMGIVSILLYTDVYLAEAPSYANIIVIVILITTSTLLEFLKNINLINLLKN